MGIEDNAIKALQSIVKEVNEILKVMKEKRKDSKQMDSQDTAKLTQINDLLLTTKKQIIAFINRYNIQTDLSQFDNN